MASFDNSTHFYLITEFIPGGDLFYHLQQKKRFSHDDIVFYGAQLVMALEYLHGKNVIYRNIIPENVMITENGFIKLVDFSCSKVPYQNFFDFGENADQKS
jgi:serine/threonine protein kinase